MMNFTLPMAFRSKNLVACLCLTVSVATAGASLIGLDDWRYDGAAGKPGSLAISKDDSGIVGWATGYENYIQGSPVSAGFSDPLEGLGPAEGNSFDVVTLGNGGQITLTFASPIRNSGTGPDFAVFENGFGDSFLELAWVEVSSDGIHFVRFPNFSYTNSVEDGGSLDPRDLHGYAGKYRQGFGTAFDLDQLRLAFAAAENDPEAFSPEFQQQLMANFGQLDLESITHVRLVDIVGDGSSLDAGADPYPIYDPLNSSSVAGFDLDALAVLNQVELSGIPQSIDFAKLSHQRLADEAIQLQATASSKLEPSFEVLEGPATLAGSLLSFTGLGKVVVQATQSGGGGYAPATPVTRSFYVADELQHIFFEPVANLPAGSTVPLHLATTSGFFPLVEIVSGPADASTGFPPNITLNTGSSTGTLVLRAYQVGGEKNGITYAPAEDLLMEVEIVPAGSPNASRTFATWQTVHSVSGSATQDSDLDGASDFEEYAGGTDPNDAASRPHYSLDTAAGAGALAMTIDVDRRALVRVSLEASSDLSALESWDEMIPETEAISVDDENAGLRTMRLRLPKNGLQRFWRVAFEEL
jgi:hypothetical protein